VATVRTYQVDEGAWFGCADDRFRRSRPTVGAEVMRSIGGSVCVHPVLRSTHAWLLLASGTTSYRILCTAVYLPSDHPHLQGCSGCDPGRALVLWEQELGEAAQAPERSRFHGSKGKAQVGGDL
jgi:hypothetical protein